MKINKFVEDLQAKSAAELNEELVAAFNSSTDFALNSFTNVLIFTVITAF